MWHAIYSRRGRPGLVGLGISLGFGTELKAAVTTSHAPNYLALPQSSGGLHALDWIVISAYLAAMLTLGWYFSRGSASRGDYFIAAARPLHPALVGISLFATLLSTISYLGKPGEMINKGPVFLVGQILSVPLAYFVVGYGLIPRFMQHRVSSAYELLEVRLGLGIRLLGAAMFIALRLAWMGLLIYLSSVALAVIVGLDLAWVPAISAVTGLVAVIYTSMGGLRTVVITDVVQFALLFIGATITIVVISFDLEGISWLSTDWSPTWDRQPWFSVDPHVRVSVFGATLSMLVWRVATAGGDQTAIQRYMATQDTNAARRSYLVNSIATVIVTVLLAMLGLALLKFFSQFPEALGNGLTLAQDADRIFPYFISHYLPIGVSGLVVSAALAAAMSSVDSGVNSITAVVMSDFLQRFGWEPKTEAGALHFSKAMALAIGLAVIGASLFVQHVPGNFNEMTTKTSNLIVSPIFALFVLALWVPFATPLGAWLGCAYGIAAAVLISFWEVFTDRQAISFQWIGAGSLFTNLLVAVMVSRWGPGPTERRRTAWASVAGLAVLAILLLMVSQNFH